MTKTAREVFRDYETDGVPASGPHKVHKADVREWGGGLEALINAGGIGGAVWKETHLDLTADLDHDADTVAVVYEDDLSSNNGLYVKVGASGDGEWRQITTFLPGYQFVTASDDGSSTLNAYRMVTSPRLPSGDGVALVEFVVPFTNTSSTVSIKFDSDAPLTIRTASGNLPPIGGLVQGMPVSGVKVADSFYLRSDISSSAIQMASEAAAELARKWAEGTLPGGGGTKSAREWAELAGVITLGIAPVSASGDGATTTLSLPIDPVFVYNVRIAIDGVAQKPGASFTVSGTTLTWSEPPPNGSEIFGYIITATEVSVGVPSAGTVNAASIDTGEAAGIVAAIGAQALYAECQGRLSLSTGVAVTTADVSAAGNLYWVPYCGERVWLYSGTLWRSFAPGELSIALSAGTASRPHDVFLDYNAGVPQLALAAWTNDTTRATGLASQNGILVKSGATSQRYLGTIYLNGSKQCEDSFAKRWVWNMYHRKHRPMRVLEGADTWNYTLATIRQANNNAANQLDFVRGLDEEVVEALVSAVATNGTVPCGVRVFIGLDGTTAPATGALFTFAECQVANRAATPSASYRGLPGVGRHALTWLESSTATGTTTWYGDNGSTTSIQSGIAGSVTA